MTEKRRLGEACRKCGGRDLVLPDGYDDATIAKCGDCGHALGWWAEFKERTLDGAPDCGPPVPVD